VIKDNYNIIKGNYKIKDGIYKYNKKSRIIKESKVITAMLKRSDCY
jgi:hypothetical protein